LGGSERIAADPRLTEALIRSAPSARAGTVLSVDVLCEPRRDWRAQEALVVEMQTAALFAVGSGAEVPVACLLTVSDTFDPSGARQRIDDHALLAAAETMGAAGAAALSP
jgi:nucleoside phosphorylase